MLVIKTVLASGRRAKGRDLPFQKENTHYQVSKLDVSELGVMRSGSVSVVQWGGANVSGVNREILQEKQCAEQPRAGL